MAWLLPRLLITLGALVAGALLGQLVGQWLGAPMLAGLVGAAVAVSLAVAQDVFRAARLMLWLRGTQERDAPRDTGFWGELGYRVERAVRQRERQTDTERQRLDEFLSAIEASPNGVLLLDASSHISWCNAVGADHLGLDPQRDRGQPITNLLRVPAFVSYLQAGDWREPVTFAARAGEVTLSVLVRAYGEGQKLIVSQDVTERLRAEAMRRDFVANVSHEIRTPLTVLAGFVETMTSLPLSPAERGRVLVLMQQQTDRMQALVSDLLTLAQLEGSPRPPADRWLPLAPLLQRIVSDGRTLSAGRHQLLLHEQGVPAVQLAGSETELVSAVANLVTNAVRYTPEGGTVTLSSQRRADGGLEIAVRDTGVGIAREHLPRLTERFYRVDGSRARETGGTGLGLAIVKHVVQRHGGELDVDSTPGQGSCFRLLLPGTRVRPLTEQPLSATV